MSYGLTTAKMLVGYCSIYSLLSIVQFWYGMARYPSIWNRYVPPSLKGSTSDKNFKEIKDICGYHHNGHHEMNSQFIPFVVTLPFTFIFHAAAFLVTASYSVLKMMNVDLTKTKLFRDPIITSIFVSNSLVSSIWLFGGTEGMVYVIMTIFFNQKAYNSLLFKKDIKSFFLSLVFGNLLVVSRNPAAVEAEIALSERTAEIDLEEGLQNKTTAMLDKDLQQISASVKPMRYLPPLLGASSSSSTNDETDQNMAPENISLDINDKIIVEHQNDDTPIDESRKKESPVEVFSDEDVASQPSNVVPLQFSTVSSLLQDLQYLQNVTNIGNEKISYDEPITEELEHSKGTAKKGFLGLSRRILSGARTKYVRKKGYTVQDHFDDQISVESLNSLDVHLDKENHTGTVEWRNIIIESTQRFKIKSYTMRKHNWVMSKMHGRSFFVTGDGKRQRKLKKKEIKFHCQKLHDKQLLLASQINGILNDLKGLKENISTKRCINQSLSKSERTKLSFSKLPSQVIQTKKGLTRVMVTEEGLKIKFFMNAKNETPKLEGAESGKDSLGESRDSTVSTLTNSIDEEPQQLDQSDELQLDQPKQPDHTKTVLCINEFKEKVLQADADSALLKDTIDGLLKCGDWAENINVLKDPETLEKNDSLIDPKNTTESPAEQQQLQHNEDSQSPTEEDEPIGAHRGGATEANKPYWQNYVELPEIFKEKPKKKSYEVSYPWHSDSLKSDSWRSELQKKKSEKAQEDRMQSSEIVVQQMKRIIPILKNVDCLERTDDENRDQQTERHQLFDDGRCGVENLEETPWLDFSDCRNDFVNSPEMNTTHNKLPDMNFAKECSAFEGMSDAYSQCTEQRDESVLSGCQLISTNRVS